MVRNDGNTVGIGKIHDYYRRGSCNVTVFSVDGAWNFWRCLCILILSESAWQVHHSYLFAWLSPHVCGRKQRQAITAQQYDNDDKVDCRDGVCEFDKSGLGKPIGMRWVEKIRRDEVVMSLSGGTDDVLSSICVEHLLFGIEICFELCFSATTREIKNRTKKK